MAAAVVVLAHLVLPTRLRALTLVALVVILVAGVLVRARRDELGTPHGWYLMAAAACFSFAGVAVIAVETPDLFRMSPLANAITMPGQVLMLASYTAFVRARTRSLDRSQLLDLGIITLSFTVALKEAFVEAAVHANPHEGVPPTVTMYYALIGMAAFFVVIRLVSLPGRRPLALWLLLAGAAVSVMGTSASHDTAWATHSAVISGLFALAAVWAPDAGVLSSPSTEAGGLGRWRLAGLGLALVAVPVAAAVEHTRTDELDAVMFLPPTVIVVVLVMIRLRLVFVAETRAREAHRALIEGISDVILVVDDAGRIGYVSESARSALGRDPRSLAGQPLAALADGADLGLLAPALDAALDPGMAAPTLTIPVDASPRVFEVRASDRRHDAAVNGVIFVLHDVTEQRSFQDQLHHQANHDSLTGLPNRSMLADHLEQALAAGAEVTLLFVDLDDFKTVNDTLGHVTGDDLLRVVAQRLEGAVRGGDLVARLGGDEFAVVINEDDGPVGPLTMADRILRALEAPVTMGGRQFSIEASVGITSSAGCSVEDLLRQADIAMYQVKSSGKHGYALYADSVTQ